MTTISSTALGGLYQATRTLAQAAQDVATTPITGKDDTTALLATQTSTLNYRANAAVLKLDQEREKALLDILA